MNNEAINVLLVEDDPHIRQGLKTTLSALNFRSGEASSGEEALLRLHEGDYDVVLMDLNMPGMGGVEACRRVRRGFPHISIIVVTVRDSQEDKIEALDAGADDFMTKPFQVGELTARMRAVLRRAHSTITSVEEEIVVGIFELSAAKRSLRKRGEKIRLTPTEFDLVAHMMSHAGRPIQHTRLLSAVWGPQYGNEREYLRTFIMQLRKKLEDDPANPVYLKTVNYLGYLFAIPEDDVA